MTSLLLYDNNKQDSIKSHKYGVWPKDKVIFPKDSQHHAHWEEQRHKSKFVGFQERQF